MRGKVSDRVVDARRARYYLVRAEEQKSKSVR